MNTSKRSGQGFDLDEIERQIRESSARPAAARQNEDPLAELARIVGGGPVPQRAETSTGPASIRPLDVQPALAPLPPVSQPIWPSPAANPAGYARVEDDIERLLKIVDKAPASAGASTDLDAAMRSLDELLRARGAELDAVVKHDPPVPQDDFGDWNLRTEGSAGAAAQPELEFAPPPPPFATPETVHVAGRSDGDAVHHWDQATATAEPEPYQDPAPVERPSRKPLLMAVAVIGVAAIGVGGALALRGSGIASTGGKPPVIVADKGPMKIAPANPGGIEIPDQNKQILERAPAGQRPTARVVNNEEQPLDLREAVRRETGAVVPPPEAAPRVFASVPAPPAAPVVAGPPAADPKSAPTGSTSSDVAEPRIVRTVSIKPPEPPASANGPPPSPAPVVVVSPLPTPPPAPKVIPVAAAAPLPAPAPSAVVGPTPTPPPATAAPSAAEPPASPRQKVQGAIPPPRERPRSATRATRSSDADGDQTSSAAPLQITPPPAATAPSATRRVANVERDALAATTAPAPPEAGPASSPTRAATSTGNFVVQLASEGSEQDARSAISRMQSRYGELSGMASSVQRREVKGQTRYRVRFGSLSRDAASSLCASLKGKGQDCIIQPN